MDRPYAGIHVSLRLDAHGPEAVSLRDVEALHLDVAHHLAPVPLVGDEESVVDLLALLAKVPLEIEIVGEIRPAHLRGLLDGLIDELRPVLPGDEEDRMVLQLAEE